MPKKPGRRPKKNRKGGPGQSPSGPRDGAAVGGGRGRTGRGGKRGGPRGPASARSVRPARQPDYFMQPGRNGMVVVLRRAIGNRAEATICGTMPSAVHAKMLVQQMERGGSVVKDLFMEATDDGIEALETVLAGYCEEVLKAGPQVRPPSASPEAADVEALPQDDGEGEQSDPQAEDR